MRVQCKSRKTQQPTTQWRNNTSKNNCTTCTVKEKGQRIWWHERTTIRILMFHIFKIPFCVKCIFHQIASLNF